MLGIVSNFRRWFRFKNINIKHLTFLSTQNTFENEVVKIHTD